MWAGLAGFVVETALMIEARQRRIVTRLVFIDFFLKMHPLIFYPIRICIFVYFVDLVLHWSGGKFDSGVFKPYSFWTISMSVVLAAVLRSNKAD